MRKILFICSTCLFCCLPFLLRAQENPMETLSTESYLQLMDADALAKEGKAAEALVLYRKSLSGYEEIQRRDAAFKPKVIEYRMEELKGKIAELSLKIQTTAERPLPSTSVPEDEDFRKLYLDLREKMVRDSSRLLDLEKRGIEMTIALREREEALATFRDDAQRLRRELDTARAEGSRLSAQLQKEVQDLSRFNNLLQERADKQDLDLQQLRQERARLAEEIQQTREDLAESKNKAERATEQLENVRNLSNQNAERFQNLEKELEEDLAEAVAARDAAAATVAAQEAKLKDMALLEESVIELNRRHEAQTERIATLEQQAGETASALEKALAERELAQSAKEEIENQVAAANARAEESLQKSAAAEARALEAERSAAEFQAALAEVEKGFTARAATLKNELSDAQTLATDLKASLETTKEALAKETQLRARDQEAAAKQIRQYADSLNEITLLRQMLTDRDNRLRDQKSRYEEEIASLRQLTEALATPPAPPETAPETPTTP